MQELYPMGRCAYAISFSPAVVCCSHMPARQLLPPAPFLRSTPVNTELQNTLACIRRRYSTLRDACACVCACKVRARVRTSASMPAAAARARKFIRKPVGMPAAMCTAWRSCGGGVAEEDAPELQR